MNLRSITRRLAPEFAALALIALVCLLWVASSDAAEVRAEWLTLWSTPTPPAPAAVTSPELSAALGIEYGNYQSVITPQQFMSRLQSARVLCLGEAHYEQRDMQTAFELLRLLARNRPVALAVERLAHTVQPPLDSLPALPDDSARLDLLKTLFQMDDYQRVWGARPKDRSGYPTNTPSQPVFEAMVYWAAQNRIPLIGLDVSWVERGKGLGEDAAYRTALWSSALHDFLASRRASQPLIVLVAGISHCTNAPDTIAVKLKTDPAFQPVVSVGQRDAMYQYLSPAHVVQLSRQNGLNDLIIAHPQVAVVSTKGVPEFPTPPDYWIAVHTPDTWK